MRAHRLRMRNFNVAMAGLALAMMAAPRAGHAFTEDDQRRLCTGDVFRLCSSEIPDRDRIIACMVKQRASLSDGCRSVFGRPTERSAAAAVTREDLTTINVGRDAPPVGNATGPRGRRGITGRPLAW